MLKVKCLEGFSGLGVEEPRKTRTVLSRFYFRVAAVSSQPPCESQVRFRYL